MSFFDCPITSLTPKICRLTSTSHHVNHCTACEPLYTYCFSALLSHKYMLCTEQSLPAVLSHRSDKWIYLCCDTTKSLAYSFSMSYVWLPTFTRFFIVSMVTLFYWWAYRTHVWDWLCTVLQSVVLYHMLYQHLLQLVQFCRTNVA